jgi:exosortase F-associated protein
MFQKIRNHKFQIAAFLAAVVGFALIRNYEEQLFYDPFLSFFKGIKTEKAFPEIVEWKLYVSLFMRYLFNTLLSLFVIYALFKNKEHLKLASILYLFFFIILVLLFVVALNFFSERYMLLFYIRRFIIQPLFLLLFVPGFYFQQQDGKKQNS